MIQFLYLRNKSSTTDHLIKSRIKSSWRRHICLACRVDIHQNVNPKRRERPQMTSRKFESFLTRPSPFCHTKISVLHTYIVSYKWQPVSPNLCDVIYECSLSGLVQKLRYQNFGIWWERKKCGNQMFLVSGIKSDPVSTFYFFH